MHTVTTSHYTPWHQDTVNVSPSIVHNARCTLQCTAKYFDITTTCAVQCNGKIKLSTMRSSFIRWHMHEHEYGLKYFSQCLHFAFFFSKQELIKKYTGKKKIKKNVSKLFWMRKHMYFNIYVYSISIKQSLSQSKLDNWFY